MKHKRLKFIYTALLLVIIQCNVIVSTAQETDIIRKENLIKHMEVIASDATEGRFTATKGYRIAADYAEQVFKEAGLEPVVSVDNEIKSYFQPIPFTRYNYDRSFIGISKKGSRESFVHSHDNFVVLYPGSEQNELIQSSPVFISYGIFEPEYNWNDYSGVDVDGKWVIMLDGIPPSDSNYLAFPDNLREQYTHWKAKDSLKYTALKNHNVAGVIILPDKHTSENWEIEALRKYRFNYTHYGKNDLNIYTFNPDIPYILLHPNLAQKLMTGQVYNPITNNGNYQSFALKDIKLDIKIVCQESHVNCQNVIAVVPGTDSLLKDEFITVGAHLDHIGKIGSSIYNGANDNAGSCAIILEAAKALAQNPAKRSVLFILYTSEEQYLIGSKYFLKNSPIPVENIVLNINIEQIGSKNREYSGIWIISPEEFKIPFQAVGKSYTGTELVFDLFEEYRNALRTTDLWNYIEKRIPSIMMSSGGFPEYHSPKDKIDLIDFDHLFVSSNFLYSLIDELGNGTDKDQDTEPHKTWPARVACY